MGWGEMAKVSVKMYHYNLNSDGIRKQAKLERLILDAAKMGKTYKLKSDERYLLNLPFSRITHNEIASPYYKLKNTEIKTLGWLRESEHPNGILCKPCPVCGYEYGTAWKYFPVPAKDEAIIIKLLNEGRL